MKRDRQSVNLRHAEMLALIRQRQEVLVDELCEIFDVSPMTVRRDLQVLENQGKINRFHGGAAIDDQEAPESGDHVEGDESLDGACETSAVDSEGASSCQIMVSHGQRQGDRLMGRIPVGVHILQIHIGGMSRFSDQVQKTVKCVLLQCLHLLLYAAAVGIIVDRAHEGAVTQLFPEFRNCFIKVLFIDFREYLFAESLCH